MPDTNFFNTTNSCNDVLNNCTIADEWSQTGERSHILAWKSSLEPRLPRQDIRDRRAKNVSERLLQTEGFRSRCAGRGEVNLIRQFFYHGDQGAGQTL